MQFTDNSNGIIVPTTQKSCRLCIQMQAMILLWVAWYWTFNWRKNTFCRRPAFYWMFRHFSVGFEEHTHRKIIHNSKRFLSTIGRKKFPCSRVKHVCAICLRHIYVASTYCFVFCAVIVHSGFVGYLMKLEYHAFITSVI